MVLGNKTVIYLFFYAVLSYISGLQDHDQDNQTT